MVVFIDGPDGSGKGTILKRLKELHPEIEIVRIPGAEQSSTCGKIRDIVLNTEGLDPRVSYLLMWADIYQAFSEIVKHSEDKIVLLDRWITSTYVYQVKMLGICDDDFFGDLHTFYDFCCEYWPTYGIYLSIEAGDIRRRLALKSLDEPLNQYDNMVLHNLDDIIHSYDEIIGMHKSLFHTKIVSINAGNDSLDDKIRLIEDMIFDKGEHK